VIYLSAGLLLTVILSNILLLHTQLHLVIFEKDCGTVTADD